MSRILSISSGGMNSLSMALSYTQCQLVLNGLYLHVCDTLRFPSAQGSLFKTVYFLHMEHFPPVHVCLCVQDNGHAISAWLYILLCFCRSEMTVGSFASCIFSFHMAIIYIQVAEYDLMLQSFECNLTILECKGHQLRSYSPGLHS